MASKSSAGFSSSASAFSYGSDGVRQQTEIGMDANALNDSLANSSYERR